MIRTKNKIAAFLLLIIVVMPLLLSVGYLVKKIVLEKRMEYKLQEGTLQKFVLPFEEVQWIKKDKEILIAGKFFDIKSFRRFNNNLEVTGIFDQEENELHAGYRRFVEHGKNSSSPYHAIALKFIFTAIIHAYSAKILPPIFYITAPLNSMMEQKIINRYSPVLIPPPKM